MSYILHVVVSEIIFVTVLQRLYI